MTNLIKLLASLSLVLGLTSIASAASTTLDVDNFAVYQSDTGEEKKKKEGEEEEPDC